MEDDLILSYFPEIKIPPELKQSSELFFSKSLRKILDLALEGEIPAYHSYSLEKATIGSIHQSIRSFSGWIEPSDEFLEFGDTSKALLFEPFLETEDTTTMFSLDPFLKRCVIRGLLMKKGKSIFFRPKYLIFIWVDPGETLPSKGFITVTFDDLKKLKVRHEGVRFAKFIRSFEYLFVIDSINKVGMTYEQGFEAKELLLKGEWETLHKLE